MAKSNTRKHPAETAAEVGSSTSPWKTNVDTSSLKALTLPPTVKIKDMPVGAVLDVTIYDLIPSQKKDIKNPLALAVNHADGAKIAIPVVGGLAGTLLADKECDLKKVTKDDLNESVSDVRIYIKKTGLKRSNQYKDDAGQGREYPIFEVTIAE